MENAFLRDTREWENDPEYQTEFLILEINEQICEWMEKQNISRAELANRLGKSRAYITRMLNGSHNLTIGTMMKVAMALGAKPKVQFVDIPSVNADNSVKEEMTDSRDNRNKIEIENNNENEDENENADRLVAPGTDNFEASSIGRPTERQEDKSQDVKTEEKNEFSSNAA